MKVIWAEDVCLGFLAGLYIVACPYHSELAFIQYIISRPRGAVCASRVQVVTVSGTKHFTINIRVPPAPSDPTPIEYMYTPYHPLRHDQVVASLDRQPEQPEPPKEVPDASVPPLALLLGDVHVPLREEHPVDAPEDAEGGGGDGVAQAGEEEEGEVVGVVLEEVGVGALGRVEAGEAVAEGVRVGGVDLLIGGVGVGVGDAGGAAGGADGYAVPDVDEGGEGAGEDDVAGGCQIGRRKGFGVGLRGGGFAGGCCARGGDGTWEDAWLTRIPWGARWRRTFWRLGMGRLRRVGVVGDGVVDDGRKWRWRWRWRWLFSNSRAGAVRVLKVRQTQVPN